MFHVVLVAPEIPPNTGNIGRLCLATDSRLHLIKPLGFSIDDRQLQRAGLDYWKDVKVSVWESFEEFQLAQPTDARFWYITTKTDRRFWDAIFCDGDYLVFGRETKGLPEKMLAENADTTLTIPMVNATRSLNLATAVGIVLYEAVRQYTVANPPLVTEAPPMPGPGDEIILPLDTTPDMEIHLPPDVSGPPRLI